MTGAGSFRRVLGSTRKRCQSVLKIISLVPHPNFQVYASEERCAKRDDDRGPGKRAKGTPKPTGGGRPVASELEESAQQRRRQQARIRQPTAARPKLIAGPVTDSGQSSHQLPNSRRR